MNILLKVILGHDHGGRRTDPLYALLPGFQAVEDLDLHPQIINGNL
jgi:hypothetical protein